MPDRYYQASVVVVAGTSQFAPLTVPVILENALLVDVEIQIPPGHSGLTGIHIRQSHQQIIPWGNLSWLTADNFVKVFEHNGEIGSRAIDVQAFNTDFFDHTFYVRFHIRDLITPGGGGLSGATAPVIGATQSPQGNLPPLDTIGGGIGGIPLPPSLELPPPPAPPSPVIP